MSEGVETIQIGNAKQHGYAYGMLSRLPSSNALEVCKQVLGQAEKGDKLSVPDASKVIAHLEGVLAASGLGRKRSAPAVLSAAGMRRIAEGIDPRPEDLDEDTAWVLEMLERYLSVREIVSVEGVGRNRGGPIQMEALVEYFRGWDALARALGVTVPTAKAWGAVLPQSRAYEVEVKTNRTFRAPR